MEESHHDGILLVPRNCIVGSCGDFSFSVCFPVLYPLHITVTIAGAFCHILSHVSPVPAIPLECCEWCLLSEHMSTDRLLVSVVSLLPFVWDLVAFGSIVVLKKLCGDSHHAAF